ncbi:hypothetical protein E4K64_15265 [Bradyrhizobium frederickii]|uniref:Uncharacterized protein n=1 Tax=Bradyrhizobium frederickii TaxID=2560054 RepID=A0A4Y9P6E9_9BRAD|nr:hypothetical protein E4K64_15265 [Bradyrhizobium frederickii]
MRCIRIARLAPQDDGIDTVSAERVWLACAFVRDTPLSCPGRSAASLRRCAAEPGPMQQRVPRPAGSRLCAAA